MAAEPFIEPTAAADSPARLWVALGFIAFGVMLCAAVIGWMGPISVEAQANPPVPATVVAIERSKGKGGDRTAFRIEWTDPNGAKATGRLQPLLEDFHVGQTVTIRYAYAGRAQPHLFLDTPLELWGPVTGIALVGLASLGPVALRLLRRLRAARRAAPTPDSGPTP